MNVLVKSINEAYDELVKAGKKGRIKRGGTRFPNECAKCKGEFKTGEATHRDKKSGKLYHKGCK